ncbi:MAG: hypothetical protein ACD_49C00054G0003 [uncultured bacterium (gcode 4)]|uniref:Uncharacterized protein n=1 Tax=uncultured bacterium (gcode 4) TaxID=1234023 RepID=K2AX40_9BACT|nr:MAG: hypothetical protein ACD_49C00054G0003 [uncultured bacterium (gcode 4)]
MWFTFNFRQIEKGDAPNIQICFEGKNNWDNIAHFNWNTIKLSENFTRNLMSILNSEQTCTLDLSNKSITRWKFDDCHSFAFALTTWSSLLFHGSPEENEFEKFWLKYIWTYNELSEKNKLKQWDLLTNWKYLSYHELSFINQHNHSFVYLWNIWGQDSFINCHGFEWYIDRDWAWIKEFTEEIWKIFFDVKNWVISIKEWFRKWWRLAINTMDEILVSYSNTWKVYVYRKED